LAGALLAGATPRSAQACGGFFCDRGQPVNQAAERIIFSQNGDGTVTAVIEIMYQGPSENFSWLLPITSVPEGDEIAVASKIALDRLQASTNPIYRLNVRVEGECDIPDLSDDDGGFASGGEAASGEGGGGNVQLEASGVVGSFDYAVISVNEALPEPADAAVNWLSDNGYDVPEGSPGLLQPYLEDGMYLLALKLQKGADSGSIRPIVITYDGSKPMIPIKLTAVAANDDMGVLAFLLSDARAVPLNYNALELNEARINWFNPNSNYNDVVIAAADEANGHGFVTEFADRSSRLSQSVWSQQDEDDFAYAKQQQSQSTSVTSLVVVNYAGFDGFWDVFRKHVTLPKGKTVEDVQRCWDCVSSQLTVSPLPFVQALETEVIQPVRDVQRLIDSHPYLSRLYTTMSAAEMTVDPLFGFNPSLPDVDNVHMAERIIECGHGYYQWEAPWRIELPEGGVVRGGPEDVGIWPAVFGEQPANRRILRVSESGAGNVLQDNSELIDDAVTSYSDSVPDPPRRRGLPTDRGGLVDRDGDGIPDEDQDPHPARSGLRATGGQGGDGGCSVAGIPHPQGAMLLLLALVGAWRRRGRPAQKGGSRS
jgi:hypothetical protein